MWLMVSSLSPHCLHLLFVCVLSILTLIWMVIMALFCAAIRKDSVSLLKFPFLSHVQILSCEMLFISRLKRPWIYYYYYYYYYYYCTLLRVFDTNVIWWSFTGVWVTDCYFYSLRVFLISIGWWSFTEVCVWPHVSSSLQDTSQYSDWSQQYCRLNCLHSSSYF